MPALAANIDLILLPSNLSKDARNPPKDLSDQPTNQPSTQRNHVHQCSHQLFTTATNGDYQCLPTATPTQLDTRKKELPCTHILCLANYARKKERWLKELETFKKKVYKGLFTAVLT